MCEKCKKECSAVCFYKKFGYSFNREFRKHIFELSQFADAPFIIIPERKSGSSLVIEVVNE